jgi:hypothetical protein
VDQGLIRWQAVVREHLVSRREELMTPCPGTPLGPPAAAT